MKFSRDSMTPSNSGAAKAADEFSPEPLLNAFENFRGSFFDLDRRAETSADDLKRLKIQLTAEMKRQGLGAGDVLLVALHNGTVFAAALAACLEVGACPLLVHGETPRPELDRIVTRWKAQFLISEAGSGERDSLLPLASQGSIRWERTEVSATGLGLTAIPLHPTSGTTGGPKIAVRAGPCAVAEPLHYIETLSIDKSDTILCAVPMSHAYAYGMCLLVTLLTSARLVFMRRFSPDLTRIAADEMGISIFPAVPIMLDSLLAMNAGGFRHRPRVVLSAGAPLLRDTFDACRRKFGISVRPLYGTTETGGISIADPDAEFGGSVGVPMRGVEVDLRGQGQNSGDVRAVRVRSSSMMAGYLEGEAVSREAIKDGWFETGDFARVDAQGRIFLQGRLSDVINVFGYKVIPKEVEDVILLLPEIAEVKVYAGKHLGPDIVQAAVVCRDRVSETEILRHCEKHLVGYKCPTAVKFVKSLPRTATGKIDVDSLIRSGE